MALNYPNNPTEGQKWTDPNGVEWEFKGYGWKEIKVPTLASMTDVSSSTPNVGDKLEWDGANWVPKIRSVTFSNVSDIEGTPVIGDYLIYNSTTETYQMASLTNTLVACRIENTDNTYFPDENTNLAYEYRFFNTVSYDTDSMADLAKNRITIKEDGYYSINCVFATQDDKSSLWQSAVFRVYNSSNVKIKEWRDTSSRTQYFDNNSIMLSGNTRTLNLNVGDYVKLYYIFDSQDAGFPVFDQYRHTNISLSVLKLKSKI